MSYIDKRDWHYEENSKLMGADEYCMCIPGIYMVWCIFNDLQSFDEIEISEKDLKSLQSREVSISDFFEKNYDGKLSDDCFNDRGLKFTKEYYDSVPGQYYSDLSEIFDEKVDWSSSVTQWNSFDKISPLIDEYYGDWIPNENTILEVTEHIKVAPFQYSDKMKIIMDYHVKNITDEELIDAIKRSDIISGGEEVELIKLIPSLSKEKKEELVEIFFHVGDGTSDHDRIIQQYGEIE